MNTKSIESTEERKKLKRAARKKAAPKPKRAPRAAIRIGVKNWNPRVTFSSRPSNVLRIRVGSISVIIGAMPAHIPVPNPAVNIAAEISPGIVAAEFHSIVGGIVPAAISRP